MQDFLKRLKYPTLTFILSLAVLFYFFHVVLLAPNDYLFAPGGDGIKNYYAFMFHARYEPSFWEFNGMNYPYYVHIVYADAHPLFSWIIGRLGLYEYGVGILNMMMLLSYPICSVFLYKIFKHYKVEVLWAIVAAIGITYLAPQLGRLTGHLSMAYVFAVPVMWWLLIKCNGSNKIRWSIITALYLLAFFFTHPYLGIILAFLSLFYWLVYFLYDRSKWKVALSSMSLQVFVPFIIFQSAIILTDTHVDRIDAPGGFYNLHAGWSSILAAHHGPMNNLTHLLHVRFMTWESWAYVGFSTIIFSLIVGTYAIVKRKTLTFKKIFRHELFLFVIAAWIILVFSFCFPFKFTWMRWVTDYIGPLKQFRVLGRFTWIFFYVITTASVIAYYRMYLKEGKKFGLALVFYLGAAFYFVESHDVTMGVSDVISEKNNSFKKEYLREDMAELIDYVDENEYDAIILLPFMHLSSENIMIIGEEQAGFDSYILSYHTGLPLLNSLSSRMSQSESILFNNFFSPEFIEKELVYEFPEGDKIVLVLNDDYLNVDEQRITFTQEKDFVNNTFIAYDFDLDKWNTDYYFNEVLEWEKEATYDVATAGCQMIHLPGTFIKAGMKLKPLT